MYFVWSCLDIYDTRGKSIYDMTVTTWIDCFEWGGKHTIVVPRRRGTANISSGDRCDCDMASNRPIDSTSIRMI